MSRTEGRSWENAPGYLGYAGLGEFIFRMHANWPVYPCAPDGLHGLIDLGQFPEGTAFVRLDDIDKCLLFYVPSTMRKGGPWDEAVYHLAIWHESLNWLAAQGYIVGSRPATEREWQEHHMDVLKKELRRSLKELGSEVHGDPFEALYERLEDGQFRPIRLPNSSVELEDSEGCDDFAIVDEGAHVRVTDQGWDVLTEVLGAAFPDLCTDARLQSLVSLGAYDTAVR